MMKQDFAETQALALLAWLVSDEELRPVFMGATGVGEDDIRARAGEPEFLASVVDFILMDDRHVIDAADGTGIRPEDMVQIRAALPGGILPNWT